jgi:hypothetical protein
MRHISLFFLLVLFSTCASAQDSISNGGFNVWHGGVFDPGPGGGEGCCGVALASPQYWGIPELLMAMPTNQFVYKETDTAHIHSGSFSAQLYTRTTTQDSAGDLAGGIAVLVPGAVTCAGIVGYGALGLTGDLTQNIAYSTGLPFTGRPASLRFYMMIEHDAADTMHYAYVFTRWDSVNQAEDTISYHSVDIPDTGMPADQWMAFSDPISYLSAAIPDTLHLIFYGGRNGNPDLEGNITWLDDVSFLYGADTATGIVPVPTATAAVYPSPASGLLSIRLDEYKTGCAIELYDLTGRPVMTKALTSAVTTLSVSPLTEGLYLYRIMDENAVEVKTGKVAIER